jgi:hypothetical protein
MAMLLSGACSAQQESASQEGLQAELLNAWQTPMKSSGLKALLQSEMPGWITRSGFTPAK